MEVEVRLFAGLRERAGSGSVCLQLEEGATVGDAMTALGDLVGEIPVVMALNREYASADTLISAGDELAVVPPVSGGAGDVHVRVCEEALDPQAISGLVSRPEAGAIVTFQGVTREVDALDYEAYAEMALERMRSIAEAVLADSGACAIAAEHRVGRVALGEPSVVVAASGPHRDEAFGAARGVIDRIKEDVPIWKRERGDWVQGAIPTSPARRP